MPPPAGAVTSSPARALVQPRAFAERRTPDREELLGAPVHWPRPSRLAVPIALAPGKAADGAAALGLVTVGDLFEHLPRDRRESRTVAGLEPGEQATVAVQVRSISSRAVRRRGMRPLVQATVFDETGSMHVAFFNQPWLVSRYPPGTRLLLHGRAERGHRFNVAHHAISDEVGAEPDGESGGVEGGDRQGMLSEVATSAGGVAHYAASEGITSTQLLTLVRGARASLADVIEPLPGALRAAERLPDRAAALGAMHFPRSGPDPEAGRERLAFEELLLTQLVFLRRRARRRERRGAPALDGPRTLTARWHAQLPFSLTADQRAAIEGIDADLATACPMQRLLMGEVGAGKTVVAVHAMLRAVEHGHQAALMAPTETLAEQHFATLSRLLGGEPVSCALLTGSTPARRRADVLGKLSSGELSLIVGTHALIEPAVKPRSLAVVIVDEQHRFGVRQREALDAKAAGADNGDGAPGAERAAHVLHMTATPIPRTLALARYGDLDQTALHELPHGRRAISTRIVNGEAQRERAYEQVREELRAGRQAYVVCPLVEQSETEDGAGVGGASETRAAKAEFERLAAGDLAGFRLSLLHGQMRPREKQRAMAAFAAGESDVLVATTVIEVGIDVANATVMLVENAERFGMSQLHQLRGRIGRGEHASTCLLVGPPGSPRLRALEQHSDGFRLAELDLQQRNEGELVGTRQSGLGQFKVARLPDDQALLNRARACAQQIVAVDPQLRAPEHALLADALAAAFGEAQLDPIPA
jgi:ATP-dependent DNA helicase RecG